MPANLTPQYLDAEQRFKEATTPADKLKALRHMMAVIPKHKGTEKLRAEIKRKISRTQDDIERERHSKTGRRPDPGHVPHEGAGQVALLGAPNSGKSRLLAALTHAHPKVAEYPFTTHEPMAGMMPFEDVHVQLVDTPAVSAEYMEAWMPELLRRADRALLVLDLGNDALLDDFETLQARLGEKRVTLRACNCDAEDDEIETLVAANQCDRPDALERLELVRAMLGELGERVFVLSAETGEGLEELRTGVFQSLRVVRVYTKMPHEQPDYEKPFVVPSGSTVEDLALLIHKDIAANLKFARIWGSARFDGQSVQHDHVLEDRDVIEIHASP